jgi:hypothetical protein
MEIKNIIDKVKKSEEFEIWQKDVSGYYLSYVYKMLDANKDDFQVGFINKETDYVATFEIDLSVNMIKFIGESEPFKKPEDDVHKLNIDKVEVDWKDALAKSEEVLKKEYSAHVPINTFFILQKLEEGDVYNITYLSKSFSTINLKISAQDGSVLSKSCNSIMDLAKWEKGEKGKD